MIPKALKQMYFPNKSPPDLIKDYDAIGFSIDSCFVEYHEKELICHVIRSLLTSLHEDCHYPKEVLQFDYDKDLKFFLNNAIWDIQRGTVLKVGENGKITHGVHGYDKLSLK